MVQRALRIIYKLTHLELGTDTTDLPIVEDVFKTMEKVKRYFPGAEGVTASLGKTQTESEKKKDEDLH